MQYCYASPIRRLLLAIGALSLGFTAPSPADDLQVWNVTEFTAVETKRLKWEIFGVVRTRDNATDAYDKRLGTLFKIPVNARLSFGAGYLRRWVDPEGGGTHQENRLFLGPTLLLAQDPVRIESLTLYERHIAVPGEPDFNRYKQQFEFEKLRKRISPFLYEQMTFRREGFARSRARAGIRWRLESGIKLELGYQFESVKIGDAWIPRHSIHTLLNLGTLTRLD